MADLAVEPSGATPGVRVKSRVLRAPFGDGYSQRAGDGINNVEKVWNVEWDNLDDTEISSLETQLESAQGVTAIDWTAPDETVAEKFTIEEWNKEMVIGNVGKARKMSAVLRKEFDLG